MNFGQKLKELREARKVSRRDLAVRVRLRETYLEKIERGYNSLPATLTLCDLARILRVRIILEFVITLNFVNPLYPRQWRAVDFGD